MNEIKPFISVIVPVYNTEKRLVKCIESILAQNYTNFELLLIDDGSNDSSGKICDNYIKKDSRIKVFHKENGGASSARNLGIENSTGDYICFVDSDDYVDEEYLSAFFVDALNIDKDTLVIQDLQFENDISISKGTDFIEGIYSYKDFSRLFSPNGIESKSGPICKLYNKEKIITNDLRFNPNIHAGEDLLFLISYLSFIKNVYLSSKVNYHAVSSPGSLSKRYNSFESEYLTFQLLNESYTKLDHKYSLDDSAKLSIRKNSKSFFLMRAITTIYRSENRKTRNERLNILKKLYSNDNLVLFEILARKGRKINLLGFYIYKRKLFRLYDYYYYLYLSLRSLLKKE